MEVLRLYIINNSSNCNLTCSFDTWLNGISYKIHWKYLLSSSLVIDASPLKIRNAWPEAQVSRSSINSNSAVRGCGDCIFMVQRSRSSTWRPRRSCAIDFAVSASSSFRRRRRPVYNVFANEALPHTSQGILLIRYNTSRPINTNVPLKSQMAKKVSSFAIKDFRDKYFWTVYNILMLIATRII